MQTRIKTIKLSSSNFDHEVISHRFRRLLYYNFDRETRYSGSWFIHGSLICYLPGFNSTGSRLLKTISSAALLNKVDRLAEAELGG